MKLETRDIITMSSVVLADVFGENHELAGQIDTILHRGNGNHDEGQSAVTHVEHALEHLKAEGEEPSSKQPHVAHAAARLLLALMMLSRGEA